MRINLSPHCANWKLHPGSFIFLLNGNYCYKCYFCKFNSVFVADNNDISVMLFEKCLFEKVIVHRWDSKCHLNKTIISGGYKHSGVGP